MVKRMRGSPGAQAKVRAFRGHYRAGGHTRRACASVAPGPAGTRPRNKRPTPRRWCAEAAAWVSTRRSQTAALTATPAASARGYDRAELLVERHLPAARPGLSSRAVVSQLEQLGQASRGLTRPEFSALVWGTSSRPDLHRQAVEPVVDSTARRRSVDTCNRPSRGTRRAVCTRPALPAPGSRVLVAGVGSDPRPQPKPTSKASATTRWPPSATNPGLPPRASSLSARRRGKTEMLGRGSRASEPTGCWPSLPRGSRQPRAAARRAGRDAALAGWPRPDRPAAGSFVDEAGQARHPARSPLSAGGQADRRAPHGAGRRHRPAGTGQAPAACSKALADGPT